MPKYRLSSGKIVTVSDENVEAFLNSIDSIGAELINEEAKTEAVATEAAPVTAEKKAVDGDSTLEDTSSEYQEPSERDLLVFNIEETEKQINNYIEQGGEVNESDAKVLQGYKDELDEFDSKKSDEPSLLEDYIGRGTKSIASFIKGFDDIKDASKLGLLELGLNFFAPKSFYKGTPEEKKKLMEVAKMDVGLGMGGLVDYGKSIEDFIDKIEPMIREYENESMVDDIADGNYLLAGERAVGAAIESIPSVAMAALGPGGFVALGLSTAGSKVDEEFEKDPSLNTGQLTINALGTGAIQAGFEVATRGILKRASFLSNSGNKQAALDLELEFKAFLRGTDLRVYCAYDEKSMDTQREEIYVGVDIVIATPKRLNKIFFLNGINLNRLQMFIIEDAEFLFRNNNLGEITRTPESIGKCQYLVFSETFDNRFERWRESFMYNAQVVRSK